MDRMIELSPRLAAVGRLVPPGLPLVDVGTDHAYLPAALVQMGRIPSAVAPGPTEPGAGDRAGARPDGQDHLSAV